MAKKLLYFTLVFITSSHYVFSQTTGYLIRVKFDQTAIDPADTLGRWYDIHSLEALSNKQYFGHVTSGTLEYLLSSELQYTNDDYSNDWWSLNIENTENIEERSSICRIPYDSVFFNNFLLSGRYDPLKTNSGIWLLSGTYGYSFIDNSGTIYKNYLSSTLDSTYTLQHIIGKVGEKYTAAFFNADSSKYFFYLFDLDNSPNIDPLSGDKLIFDTEYSVPVKIAHLQNDLYVAQTAKKSFPGIPDICLYKLADNTFTFIKDLFHESNAWDIRNNKLVLFNGPAIRKYEFNPADSSFIRTDSIPHAMIFDEYYRYGAEFSADTLFIYDAETHDKLFSIYGNNVSDLSDIFIDSPYVYLHKERKNIGTNDNISLNADLTYKLSAYPNPFNPQTTIAFTIPNAGKVELAVYDMLGRKVTELLNEYKDKGSHEVMFNGANLASGIYFYTIRAGNFVKTNKLILLK
jgi:hypothetical protein